MSDSSLSGLLKRISNDDTPAQPRFAATSTAAPLWTLRQLVMGCEEVGLSAVGLDFESLGHESSAEGLAALHESRVEVSSLSYRSGFTGADGRTFEECVNEGWAAVRLAGLLGAENLLVTAGGRGNHIRSHVRRLLVDGLRSLAHEAADRNVTLALLPLHPLLGDDECFLESLDEAVELIDACDHRNVGLAFDTHWLCYDPTLLERIPSLAIATRLVRLADWDDRPDVTLAGRLPGDGRLPLGEVVRRFHEAGFRRHYEIAADAERYPGRSFMDVMIECRRRSRSLRQMASPSRG